ncbi:MAG: hypothetical protein KIH08_15905, partial [Candidatus Freyarchaeota archaeon]|nr:hypothetical protein [Candidatus Jordarchaeia archaeon]
MARRKFLVGKDADFLIAGVVKGIDIANIAGLVFDEAITNNVLNESLGKIDTLLENAFSQIKNIPTTPEHYSIEAYMRGLKFNLQGHLKEIRRQIGLSRASAGGTQIAGQLENTVFSAYGFSELFNAVFSIPYALATRTTAERYWNKFFGLERPDYDDAFIMWRKGLMSYDELLAILREDEGMKEGLARNFIEHLYYDPSPSELLRIVRNAPVPDDWIAEKLKEFGLDDTDLPIFQAAIKRERIKDEISRMWAAFESDYEFGLYSEKEVDDLLTKWDLSEDEKELMKTTAELRRDKAIIKL